MWESREEHEGVQHAYTTHIPRIAKRGNLGKNWANKMMQGGKITHKYNIIKGFACDAPATVLEKVEVMDAKHKATVEEDGVVTTQEN